MNERIQKLADEAGLYVDLNGKPWPKSMSAEECEAAYKKFAELIVRECANHCDLLLDHKISSEWSRGTHDCSRAIKKHFGVEE